MTDVQFKLAMERIPMERKKAYCEAMERAPELVARESNPELFLEACNHDADAAASKLAQHWTIRKRLFGDERAFLPMTLPSSSNSKPSAISDGVLDVIKRGAFVQLPDDDAGHPVLCQDMSRLGSLNIKDQQVHSDRVANFFYNLHKVATGENSKARTEGIVIIRIMNSTGFDPNNFKQTFAIAVQSMPMKIHKLLFCCMTATPGERRHVAMTLTPMLIEKIGPTFPGKLGVHVGGPSMLLKALQKEGLKEDSIPPRFGGTWCYESFERQFGASQSASKSQDHDGDRKVSGRKRPRDDANEKSRLIVENWILRLATAKLLKQEVLKQLHGIVARSGKVAPTTGNTSLTASIAVGSGPGANNRALGLDNRALGIADAPNLEEEWEFYVH